jgi:Protein of unknown function DUF262
MTGVNISLFFVFISIFIAGVTLMTGIAKLETDTLDREENDYEDEQYEKDRLIYDPEKINIVTREPTIEQLLRRISNEELDLAPEFQRHAGLWNRGAKSRLIESIIIRIPLPAFYIDATNDDKWFVVDGLQRLHTLKLFVNDKTLKLSGLEYLTNLEGKAYDQLERRYQRRIQETQVTVYTIEEGTPVEVKYNIFKRINTGGVPLNTQEIRNALNPGKAILLLAEMANSPEFKKLVNLSEDRIKRMYDRELVLNFIAFKLTSYEEYKHNLDGWLDETLKIVNKISDEQSIEKIKNDFNKAVKLLIELFGLYVFRLEPRIKHQNGPQKNKSINKALFVVWSVIISGLEDCEIEKLKQNKTILKTKYEELIKEDNDFIISGQEAWYANRVRYRFEKTKKSIQGILDTKQETLDTNPDD